MTDELEPAGRPITPDPLDPTTRVEITETPTTPPNVPLTPVGQDGAPRPYQNDTAWATSAPAVPVKTATTRRRSGRLRWAVSLVVVALVIATSAAVAAIITGRASQGVVLGYVPDHTTMYAEVRLDLPGDQRRAVGEFLSKFPGFKDQAALESKLDEVLDDLVKGATDGSQTYRTDIKPWFGGELAFSVGPLPPASDVANGGASVMGSSRALALVSITDPVAAQAWIDGALTKAGAKTTTQTYDGATLVLFDKTEGVQAALAIIDGKVVVAGDLISVKAAIDTNGSGGFSKEPGPKEAIASSDGDHVGFVYMALRPLLDFSSDLSKVSAANGAPTVPMTAALLKVLPEWGAYWLSFESDALVMEATAPVPETRLGPTENRTSTVAEHIPASALLASVSNDFGKTLKQILDLYESDPSFKPVYDQVDQALGLIGGADAAFGWAGDTAIVVTNGDTAPEAGLVIVPTDKTGAEHLFTALRAFIAIGGGQQGVTVRDEPYNGSTITIIDAGEIAGRAGTAGVSGVPALPKGHIEISYAITDDVVVIGSGPAFVKHVLDTTKDTSLAADDRYKSLVGRGGQNTGSSFADLTAIRTLIEKSASGFGADAASMAKYESDIKPFLEPFDALYAAGSTGNDLSSSVIYLTIK